MHSDDSHAWKFFFPNAFVSSGIYNEQVAKSKRSMTHTEVVIARRVVEEGRGLVVIVNKMDLLRGKQEFKKVIEAVPEEIQTVIPQVCLCIIL